MLHMIEERRHFTVTEEYLN